MMEAPKCVKWDEAERYRHRKHPHIEVDGVRVPSGHLEGRWAYRLPSGAQGTLRVDVFVDTYEPLPAAPPPSE